MDSLEKGYEYCAILDLKSAYYRVPRDKLIDVLREQLPLGLIPHVLPFLQDGWTKRTGSQSEAMEKQTRGVPQSSPLSPTLFNVFMDVLAEKIAPVKPESDDSDIILFADDVQLRAKYRISIQRDLDIAATWASQFDMTWNVRTVQPSADPAPLSMGDEPIKVTDSETYLGVTITREGITDKLLSERVEKERARLETMKRIGLNAKGFGLKLSRSMYITFIRPMFEY